MTYIVVDPPDWISVSVAVGIGAQEDRHRVSEVCLLDVCILWADVHDIGNPIPICVIFTCIPHAIPWGEIHKTDS